MLHLSGGVGGPGAWFPVLLHARPPGCQLCWMPACWHPAAGCQSHLSPASWIPVRSSCWSSAPCGQKCLLQLRVHACWLARVAECKFDGNQHGGNCVATSPGFHHYLSIPTFLATTLRFLPVVERSRVKSLCC